ncbi:hypothetical protein Tco_0518753, partial [Tanacetum coccineum]
DHMPLLATMLPPAQPAIAGESSGEAEPSNSQTVPETIIEPDHSHDQAFTPPRPTTTTASVTPPKISRQRSGMVTLGCYFRAQHTSHGKRP